MNDQFKLNHLHLKGFKSFASLGQDIEFRDVNVLCIGPNAAGKSNLVSFFRMLNFMTTNALQRFVGDQGYSDSILHFGSAVTPVMEADLVFARDDGQFNRYEFALAHASGGKLIFTRENVAWSGTDRSSPLELELGAGHSEGALIQDAESGGPTSRFVLDEPEFGLHPAALSSLAGMVKSAARKSQIILATQSPRLVDEFRADDVLVVEREKQTRASRVYRLDEGSLEQWLARYSLSELWEKNILGGKP